MEIDHFSHKHPLILLEDLNENRKIELNFHEHPLIPIQRPALFLCDACGIKHEGSSYQCGTCQFWVNQKCASLMSTIKHSDHDHFLSLTYSLPYEDYRFKSYCDICSKKVNRANWLYCCAECKYCAHVNCATSKSKLSWVHKIRQIDQKIEAKELEGNLICLPLTDESVNGIPNFTKPTQMYHVCHPHPLYFADMQINDGSYSDSKLLVCDGCSKPMSVPLYRCTECNFSLHECCAELPIEMRHPLHLQHPLILNRWQSGYSDPPSCQSCKMCCNGVLFGCLACNFFLDIECALLQGLIVHEAHEHALALRKTSNVQCAVCEYTCSGVAFVCGNCNFNIHLRCAFLPRTVRHKCDEHPLTLAYSAVKDNSDEYYCEICKEQLNTQFWFYHCDDCNQSLQIQCIRKANLQGSFLFIFKHEALMHTLALEATLDFRCIGFRHRYDKHPYNLTYSGNPEEYYCDICEGEINPQCPFYHCSVCDQSLHTICIQVDEYSNIKIGDELNVGGHPHLLTYVRHPNDISPCNRCGELLKGTLMLCNVFLSKLLLASSFIGVYAIKIEFHHLAAFKLMRTWKSGKWMLSSKMQHLMITGGWIMLSRPLDPVARGNVVHPPVVNVPQDRAAQFDSRSLLDFQPDLCSQFATSLVGSEDDLLRSHMICSPVQDPFCGYAQSFDPSRGTCFSLHNRILIDFIRLYQDSFMMSLDSSLVDTTN
ncbi:hypothetical protein TEA_004782 [Camellia sinensis var. sinensis]|uniref:Zinc finger PHD-type domain-containing protein n=1 Tax=Camellia sinensis var. sinensis TaxID=542762 RepID=A0A4S4DNQ7_CAMSN|nr:hypothetical protein TEA_004782 [Camellia sinensis var. sinensis]